jgi:regulator of sigma E protease
VLSALRFLPALTNFNITTNSSTTMNPSLHTVVKSFRASIATCWMMLFLLLAVLQPQTAMGFQQHRMMAPAVGAAALKMRTMIVKNNELYFHVPAMGGMMSSALHVSLGAPPPPPPPNSAKLPEQQLQEEEQQNDPHKNPLVSLLATPLGALAILASVVLFHETGHYWMAKSLGVAVDEFSIGLGPKLLSLGGGGGGASGMDTLFSLRALPLGGYVSLNRASMAALPWFLQVQILSAGVFFNLLLAWLIYTAQILSWMGGQGLPVPAFDAGIAVGGLVKSDKEKKNSRRSPPPPAAKGLLHPGDIIHAVNGITIHAKPTTSEMQVNRAIDKLLAEVQATPEGQSVIFTVVDPTAPERGEQAKNVKIQPHHQMATTETAVENSSAKPSIGVYLLPNFIGMDLLKTNNPLEAATLGASQVATLTQETAIGIVTFCHDNLSGKGKTSNYRVSGPVRVLDRANKIVQTQDWRTILNYAAAASINLGMFNFVPVPPTDGFQILLVTIQTLMRQQQH